MGEHWSDAIPVTPVDFTYYVDGSAFYGEFPGLTKRGYSIVAVSPGGVPVGIQSGLLVTRVGVSWVRWSRERRFCARWSREMRCWAG